jgi:MFS family permease
MTSLNEAASTQEVAVNDPGKNRRVAAASFVGTLIEGYDLIIYGTAAALVFPRVFFPALGDAAGTFASLATFAVAFVARPAGSVIFGHFGDRLGRKRTLIATLVLMGVSTILVGLVPPASAIGIAAPIVLVVLRLAQGVSAGGEWAGAALFVAEHAPKGRRGFFAMFPQLGAILPLPLASATFLVVQSAMSEDAFLSWGWRLPFLLSFLLIGVGLWIRLKVEETPVFTAANAEQAPTSARKLPITDAFRHQAKEIVVASGVVLTTFAFAYVCNAYLVSYATTTLDFTRTSVLLVSVVGGLLYAAGAVVGAVVSDKVGRRRTILTGHAAGVVWALFMFPVLNIDTILSLGTVLCVTFFIAGIVYGPVAAFLPELFSTEYRYTATGFSYNICGVVGGGIIPLLAPIMIPAWGPMSFGILLSAACALAFACTFWFSDTRDVDLAHVHRA